MWEAAFQEPAGLQQRRLSSGARTLSLLWCQTLAQAKPDSCTDASQGRQGVWLQRCLGPSKATLLHGFPLRTQHAQKQPVLIKTSLLFQQQSLWPKGRRRHLVVLGGEGYARLGPTQPGCRVLRGTTWTVTWTRWHGAVAGLAQGARLPSGREASSAATHLWLGPTRSLRPGLSHPWPV